MELSKEIKFGSWKENEVPRGFHLIYTVTVKIRRNIGYIITWMLHQIFMISNTVKLAVG